MFAFYNTIMIKSCIKIKAEQNSDVPSAIVEHLYYISPSSPIHKTNEADK